MDHLSLLLLGLGFVIGTAMGVGFRWWDERSTSPVQQNHQPQHHAPFSPVFRSVRIADAVRRALRGHGSVADMLRAIFSGR